MQMGFPYMKICREGVIPNSPLFKLMKEVGCCRKLYFDELNKKGGYGFSMCELQYIY